MSPRTRTQKTAPSPSSSGPAGTYRLVVAALLGLLVGTANALAQGTGCADVPCTDTTNKRDIDIVCDTTPPTVNSVFCEAGEEQGGNALLRIAVRCFDPSVQDQARYKDVAAPVFPEEFSELTTGCGNFIAAAHWIRSGMKDQAQCVLDTPGDGVAVPSCVSPTQADLDEVAKSVQLYAAIQPQTSVNSCFAGAEVDAVEIRNRSFTDAYRGVLAGRYICSTSTDPLAPAVCDDGEAGGGNRPDLGMYGLVSGFNLSGQSFRAIDVNVPGGTGFDFCCDRDVPGEAGCDPAAGECSPADVMCGSAAIFDICTLGSNACEQDPSAYAPLDRVIWLGPVTDVDPGDDETVAPSGFGLACLHFDFKNTLGTEQRNEDFTFGLPQEPTPLCGAPTGGFTDADFDGLFDRCEPVAANLGPSDGAQQFTLRQEVRNDVFFTQQLQNNDEVQVNGELADITVVSGKEMMVTVPPVATGTAVPDLTVEWRPAGGTFESAPQNYSHRWFGYVAEGTPDSVLVVDVFQEEEARDGHFSKTTNYVPLNCGAGISEVAAPWDLATHEVVTAALPPNDVAVREIYSVNDVTLTGGGTESRLFAFDVQSHSLLTPGGVVLPGSGRAVHVAKNDSGVARAYVARKYGPDQTTLTVVDIDPTFGAIEGDGADFFPNLTIEGLPLGIRARHSTADAKTYAYVTTVECRKPLFLGPCPIGGCRDDRRNVYLTVVDVTNPDTESMTVAAQHLIYSQAVVNCGDSEAMVGQYVNLGLEFSLDESMLFVANPEKNEVEVLDVPAHTLNTRTGTPIAVDSWPMDVTVVNRGGDPNNVIERLYVVNRTNAIVSRIDVANAFARLTPDIQLDPHPNRHPVAIEARSDGMRMYTADWTKQELSVIDLDPIHPVPVVAKQINATFATNEGFPTRLVLLRLARP